MEIRKIVLGLLLLLTSLSSFSQKYPVLYGGVEYYRDTGFEENAYINLNVGSQLFQWKFLAPEVGFDSYYGSPGTREFNYVGEPNSIAESKLKIQFSSYFFSLAPKLKFGDEEAALVLIPQYNIGKTKARGDLLVYNGDLYALEERNRYSENSSFWSFAVGAEGQIFNVDNLWFSLFFKYSFLNSEYAVESLDFSEYEIKAVGGSNDGLGVGFRVYYDLFSAFRKN